jgi:hypothetical protein
MEEEEHLYYPQGPIPAGKKNGQRIPNTLSVASESQSNAYYQIGTGASYAPHQGKINSSYEINS